LEKHMRAMIKEGRWEISKNKKERKKRKEKIAKKKKKTGKQRKPKSTRSRTRANMPRGKGYRGRHYATHTITTLSVGIERNHKTRETNKPKS
jgi:hypothetical protein